MSVIRIDVADEEPCVSAPEKERQRIDDVVEPLVSAPPDTQPQPRTPSDLEGVLVFVIYRCGFGNTRLPLPWRPRVSQSSSGGIESDHVMPGSQMRRILADGAISSAFRAGREPIGWGQPTRHQRECSVRCQQRIRARRNGLRDRPDIRAMKRGRALRVELEIPRGQLPGLQGLDVAIAEQEIRAFFPVVTKADPALITSAAICCRKVGGLQRVGRGRSTRTSQTIRVLIHAQECCRVVIGGQCTEIQAADPVSQKDQLAGT